MTLRTDLTRVLADAGIDDVGLDDALADEHLRYAAYRRIISAAAASASRDEDRALVAVIVRDPVDMVARSAVVDLIDTIALQTGDAAEVQRWSVAILAETARLRTESDREFVRRRIHDWLFYLSVEAGWVPTATELVGVTHWMQRLLADRSTSQAVLALLAEHGMTRKIRNVARNRITS